MNFGNEAIAVHQPTTKQLRGINPPPFHPLISILEHVTLSLSFTKG
jgi:hypothetical protein